MVFSVSIAQQIERIGKENPLKISGGVGTNHSFYNSTNSNGRSPYNYYVSGNLNISAYEWSMPFSFQFSHQSSSFNYRQSFNQIGMSPKYKDKFTAHLGHRSMSFSPYTMSGHTFLGVGAEVTAIKNWEVSAMYGQLQQAVEFTGNNQPFYQRFGTALKVTRSHENGKISLITFNGWDDEYSLDNAPDSLINPEENMVVSLKLEQKFFKKLSVEIETARSSYTKDKRSPEVSNVSSGGLIDGVFFNPKKSSTAFYSALKTNFSYQFSWATIGIGYEYVGPDYKTLGAYYFNNDFENTTVNVTTSLFKKKVNISANGGLQSNNLKEQKISKTRNFIGSLNMSAQASKKLSLSGSYSNFQTFTNLIPIDQQIQDLTPNLNYDSLRYTQLSQSISANAAYQLQATKKRVQNLNFSVSNQQVSSRQGDGLFVAGTKLYNGNLSYSLTFVPKKITITSGINANTSENSLGSTQLVGVTLGTGKAFFDNKLKTTLSLNANNSYINGESRGAVWVARLGLSTSVKKVHSFNLNSNLVQRVTDTGSQRDFTVNFSYNYSFSLLNGQKKKGQ